MLPPRKKKSKWALLPRKADFEPPGGSGGKCIFHGGKKQSGEGREGGLSWAGKWLGGKKPCREKKGSEHGWITRTKRTGSKLAARGQEFHRNRSPDQVKNQFEGKKNMTGKSRGTQGWSGSTKVVTGKNDNRSKAKGGGGKKKEKKKLSKKGK